MGIGLILMVTACGGSGAEAVDEAASTETEPDVASTASAFDGTFIWATHPDGIAKTDLASGAVIDTVDLGTGSFGLLYDGADLWVTRNGWSTGDETLKQVVRVSPISGEILATIDIDVAPWRLTFDGSSVWVSNFDDASISRIDRATNTVAATIRVAPRPAGLAFDGTQVLVTSREIDVDARADRTAIWTAGSDAVLVERIDPLTGVVTATVDLTGSFPEP